MKRPKLILSSVECSMETFLWTFHNSKKACDFQTSGSEHGTFESSESPKIILFAQKRFFVEIWADAGVNFGCTHINLDKNLNDDNQQRQYKRPTTPVAVVNCTLLVRCYPAVIDCMLRGVYSQDFFTE